MEQLLQTKGSRFNSIKIQRDELARNLGGGLPKNSLVLMEGPDGAGKSIFAQRLAYGFIQNKTTVTYLSTELNTMTFIEQMDSLDYDVKKDLLGGDILFIPMFPLLGYTQLDPDFFSKIIASTEVFRSEVIIFDTLSFLLIHNAMGHQEAFNIVNILKRFTSMGKTIIFCVDPTHLNETFLTLIRSVCDIYFSINIKSFAGQTVRVVSTNRFKRPEGAYMQNIPFKIEPGKGLTIEIASFE